MFLELMITYVGMCFIIVKFFQIGLPGIMGPTGDPGYPGKTCRRDVYGYNENIFFFHLY